MIDQLPIINLVLLLTTALIIPFTQKISFKTTKIMGFAVLAIVLVSNILLLNYVQSEGAFYYNLGGYSRTIGIEFYLNRLSVFFTLFVILLAIIIFTYSTKDIEHDVYAQDYGRYYTLVFILLFSMLGIVYTNDLFNTYVFMEILSITTCSIISIKRSKKNYTAAFRYLMLNEVGSLSYLFGVALLYMVTGHLNIGLAAESIQQVWHLYPSNIVIALGFMVIGVSIKAAIFPFHIWLPDAHSTAPSASSAILSAIVVKVYIIIMLKVLLKLIGVDILVSLNIPMFLTIIAASGMLIGSLFALGQKDVKRMLGYSSIAQIGYIVLGISLMSPLGLTASLFHIVSHGLMKAALFLSAGAFIYMKNQRAINGFNGLGYQMPISMIVFSIAGLGMIGIPGTSGFISKFNLGVAILDANQGFLLVVLIVSGVLNAMYYLPIMINAFLKDNPENIRVMRFEKLPKTMMFPIILLGMMILIVGFFPNLVMQYIEAAVDVLMT